MHSEKEKIYPAYVSKHKSNFKNQLILLMIPNGEGWHYLAVKKLSALLIGITSKHKSDFYCLNCLHTFRTKNRLEPHKEAWGNKDFCNIVMPAEDTKISEFNQNQKSDKEPFIIYAYLGLIEKTDGCKNNSENSSATKVGEHIPSCFSMSKISSIEKHRK